MQLEAAETPLKKESSGARVADSKMMMADAFLHPNTRPPLRLSITQRPGAVNGVGPRKHQRPDVVRGVPDAKESVRVAVPHHGGRISLRSLRDFDRLLAA